MVLRTKWPNYTKFGQSVSRLPALDDFLLYFRYVAAFW